MAYTKLIPRFTPGASIEEITRGSAFHLSIPSGNANEYRYAQLDDYAQIPRGQFPHRFDLRLSLLAQTSGNSILGTWGFGLWNDPFGLSFGFGGNPFRLPALPNAVWFFGASEENYLSFKDATTGGRDASSLDHTAPTHGFMAQTFRAPRFHPLLIPAGIVLPFSRKATRRILGKIIGEDGTALSVDVTQWHRYSLTWSPQRVSFEVDNIRVFESHVSPHPPLGLVIWIDNQYAAFTPEGKIGFGVVANPEPAWLEVKDLEIT